MTLDIPNSWLPQPRHSCWVRSIWHETFLPLDTPPPIPSRTGVERHPQTFAPRSRDGVRGRPPFWPAGDPVAQSVACVRPVVSPPVRRPDVRGCSPPSVVGRQFRRFGRACQASASKPAAQGRTAFKGSTRSSALSGRWGSGEIRFMVGGERPKADHVGFLIIWLPYGDPSNQGSRAYAYIRGNI